MSQERRRHPRRMGGTAQAFGPPVPPASPHFCPLRGASGTGPASASWVGSTGPSPIPLLNLVSLGTDIPLLIPRGPRVATRSSCGAIRGRLPGLTTEPQGRGRTRIRARRPLHSPQPSKGTELAFPPFRMADGCTLCAPGPEPCVLTCEVAATAVPALGTGAAGPPPRHGAPQGCPLVSGLQRSPGSRGHRRHRG